MSVVWVLITHSENLINFREALGLGKDIGKKKKNSVEVTHLEVAVHIKIHHSAGSKIQTQHPLEIGQSPH